MTAKDRWNSKISEVQRVRGCTYTEAYSFACLTEKVLYSEFLAECEHAKNARLANSQADVDAGRAHPGAGNGTRRRQMANLNQGGGIGDAIANQVKGQIRNLIPDWAENALGISTGTNDAQAVYLLSQAGTKLSDDQGLRLAQEMAKALMTADQIDEPTAVARLKTMAPEVGRFFGQRKTLENAVEDDSWLPPYVREMRKKLQAGDRLACSFRSTARRSGRWQLKPQLSSNRQT